LQGQESTKATGTVAALRRHRSLFAVPVLAIATAVTTAGVSHGDLASRYQAGQQHASQLQSQIHADSTKIQGFEGTLSSLQARLTVVQRSLTIQQQLLAQVTSELSAARARLGRLERQYASDRRMLASQLLADYESPSPTLTQVIVESQGFQDLLNRVSNLKTIARANAETIHLVQIARVAVAVEARRLAKVKIRREQTTAAVLDERDEIAQLRLSIVNRQLAVVHDRSAKQARLSSLKKQLTREATVLEREAAVAEPASLRLVVSPPGGCINTPFVAHGGEFGFFPAPGTNYVVNQEPVIAARLDALGKALQLHLIGISGYRTPQHSVEVGGFADDPHTRGEASDTPGVEGVPEATLEEFCLTRPFPGPREADHIQEL
jgi:peptidoglycan hydrolase CwlO-like protein